jgi:PhoU domain
VTSTLGHKRTFRQERIYDRFTPEADWFDTIAMSALCQNGHELKKQLGQLTSRVAPMPWSTSRYQAYCRLDTRQLPQPKLHPVRSAAIASDRKLTGDVERKDNVVDKLNKAIKLYITKLTRNSLEEDEGRRAMEIVSFTINLEHIGDIVDKNLCELATKKIKGRFQFSPEGAAEWAGFHKRTLEALQAGFGIFMTGDVEAARKLLRTKTEL